MIAVRILVSNPSDLTELDVGVCSLVSCAWSFSERRILRIVAWLSRHLVILLREVLAREQEHLLVETADDGNLGLSRRCLLLLLRS